MNEMSKKARPPAEAPEGAGATSVRRPVIAMRHGRGRTGGSTLLDFLVQEARAAGRPVLIGDGDRRNPTLAALYPPGTPGGATQPPTDEIPDVKDWVSEAVGQAVTLGSSLVLDLGGGDRVMQEFGRDLALVEFCHASGVDPLGLFFTGPDADDFDHVLAVWRAGYFSPERSILVMNEHLVPQGRTGAGAFKAILERPEMDELAAVGVKAIMVPRLPCLDMMRQAGLGFVEAAAGHPGAKGVPLDPVRQFMVKQWATKVRAEFARVGAAGWTP